MIYLGRDFMFWQSIAPAQFFLGAGTENRFSS